MTSIVEVERGVAPVKLEGTLFQSSTLLPTPIAYWTSRHNRNPAKSRS